MTLRVKVTPRSAKSEVVETMSDGTLKVRVAAVPEKGHANDAVCALLAVHFRVALNAVKIVSGHSASLKLVKIVKA
jgi:uncharacterized protein (TIGR00251 family)